MEGSRMEDGAVEGSRIEGREDRGIDGWRMATEFPDSPFLM
jgi:hypothetical protein